MSSLTVGGVQDLAIFPTLLQRGPPRRPGPEGTGKPVTARAEQALMPQTIGRVLAEPKAAAPPADGGAAGLAPGPGRSAAGPPAAGVHVPAPAPGAAADSQAPARRQQDEEALWTATMAALEERDRQEKVRAFLREHGFEGLNTASGWFRPRFPLHQAVENGDARMVDLLLLSKARRRVYDFKGLTPQELAREKSGDLGSQDEVLKVFKKHHARKAAERTKRMAERRQRDPALQRAAPGTSSLALPYLPEGSLERGLERAAAGASCLRAELEAAQTQVRAQKARDAAVQCDLGPERPAAVSEVAALEAALEAEAASRRAAEAEVEALRARLQAAESADGL